MPENKSLYKYDADDKMMVFTVDTKNYIRVAYSEGKVWYALCDIAKLFKYSASCKAATSRDYEVRLLRVPHTSINVKGYTNCNCVDKCSVKKFLKIQHGYEDVCNWILNVVIPKAEEKFKDAEKEMKPEENPVSDKVSMDAQPEVLLPAPKDIKPEATVRTPLEQMASLMDMLDQFIITAVSLRRELQPR